MDGKKKNVGVPLFWLLWPDPENPVFRNVGKPNPERDQAATEGTLRALQEQYGPIYEA